MSTPNKIVMVGHYGSDQVIAEAAWTSTGGIDDERRARIPALLKMLASNGHMTPFERGFLHFNVTCETASAIHLMKHRTIQMNGESARYREIKDDRYYVPNDWPEDVAEWCSRDIKIALTRYHHLLEVLVASGLSRSRAKESARFVRPYAAQTTMDISMSFRAFVDFQRLRNSAHAQLEIRELAAEALRLVRETRAFDHSLAAFGWGS